MRLTASLGLEAKYRIASEIELYPANRNTDKAVFRNAAIITRFRLRQVRALSSRDVVSLYCCVGHLFLLIYQASGKILFLSYFTSKRDLK